MANASTNGYAPVNGIKMYYECYGSGRPVILLHGGGSTIQTSFGRLIPLLARHRQVIAVELQAHGRTSDRDAPESFKQDAADVAVLMDHLNITTADIMGFSNGGHTAMQLAMDAPAMVSKLIVASAFYKRDGAPPSFWEGMAQAKFSDMPQVYKDAFMALNNDADALLNMFRKDVQRMQQFTGWEDEELRSIKSPTLLINGDADLTTPEHAALMARLIPDCELAIIPGAHGKYIGEITTLENGSWTQTFVADLLEQFLDAPGRK